MTVLEMSVGGTLLIAAILILRRIALYRLPKWSFLLLWGVALCRLLIPLSVPSQFSIYTGAARIAQVIEKEEVNLEPTGEQSLIMLSPAIAPETFWEDTWSPSVAPVTPAAPVTPTQERESISLLTAAYLFGAVLCGLYFVIAYGVGMRRFSKAKPVDSDFINRWQEGHSTLLPIKIKTCDAVSSPMAYGLLRPVILLPENTDWADENQLTYVLTHEYVHIRRGDLDWKLLLTVALCLHWFNPLVWLMYIRANQDLELACDETVVRILGMDNRKNYVYALIAAAESTFSPLCMTYTTKNRMEERIQAIMKMKKKSAALILCAAMLVVGTSAVFATSAKPAEPENMVDIPSTAVTNTTTKPAPAPSGENVPQTAPSASDAPAVSQAVPPAPEPETKPIQRPTADVEPTADTAEPRQPVQTEPVASASENRWNVDGEISRYTKFVVDSFEDAAELGKYLEASHGLYPGDYSVTETTPPGRVVLEVHYREKIVREGASMENRWNVPDGEIPQFTRFVVDSFEDAEKLGMYLEATHGLYPDDYSAGQEMPSGIVTLQVHYRERTNRERLVGGAYPVNSKGETYGNVRDRDIVGYDPDLIAVVATNGVHGYVLRDDFYSDFYTGPRTTPEEIAAFLEWQETRPKERLIPVYDVNRDTVVGYFEITADKGGMTQEEELKMIADEMRSWGNSEEQIATDLEYYKQSGSQN